MAVGDKILATKYNTMWNQANGVLAAYGVSSAGSTVGTSNRITALQWDNLKTNITKAYRHQYGYTPGYPANVSTGNVITWSQVSVYESYAQSVAAGIYTVYTGGTSGQYTQQRDVVTRAPLIIAATWTVSASASIILDFGSGGRARFFATGGIVQFNCGFSSGESPNLGWTPVLTNLNGRQLTSDTNYDSGNIFDSATNYTSNYGRLTMAQNGSQYLNINLSLNDDKGGTPDEAVAQSINVSLTVYYSVGEIPVTPPSVYSASTART